jgi:hypothetical protein
LNPIRRVRDFPTLAISPFLASLRRLELHRLILGMIAFQLRKGGEFFLSRLGWGRNIETLAQHNRHLGVAAAGAVKANFSACQRDVQLSRQRLRGVALIAGLVQNQKLIGVGSVFVENWTDTNCFSGIDGCLNSAFLYYSLPVAAQGRG